MPPRSRAHEPVEALRALTRHGVRFVVVGGFGAQLQGASLVTDDVDVSVDEDPLNLRRLVEALRELNASVRDGGRRRITSDLLVKTDRTAFETDRGRLGVVRPPLALRVHGGYRAVERAADVMDLGGFTVRVASIDDLIRMKRAAGRPKDLIAVEELGALRDEIDAQAMEARRKRRSATRRKSRG